MFVRRSIYFLPKSFGVSISLSLDASPFPKRTRFNFISMVFDDIKAAFFLQNANSILSETRMEGGDLITSFNAGSPAPRTSDISRVGVVLLRNFHHFFHKEDIPSDNSINIKWSEEFLFLSIFHSRSIYKRSYCFFSISRTFFLLLSPKIPSLKTWLRTRRWNAIEKQEIILLSKSVTSSCTSDWIQKKKT